jgi:MFS family permease
VVVALGITWILDGLEVTLAGAISPALKESHQLNFSNADVGLASSAYLAGAVLGAIFFGWLTDRLGRKRLFFITLAVYLVATAATALSWNLWSFALFRFFTGAGIGGEYTAINSTIQELVPARYRGWTDLVINGSFWVGAALGATGSIVLLDPDLLAPDLGWRLAFFIGAVLGLVIFLMRFWLPESPRWLMTHGRLEEAKKALDDIEARFRARGHEIAAGPLPVIRLRMRRSTPLAEVANTLFRVERRRTLVGLSLMAAQAFFYNAIFFTYALVLTDFYGIRADHVGWYLLPFAVGNFLGPVFLGRLFDTIGRRPMIAATYGVSGLLLAGAGYLFAIGALSATGQTIAWMVIILRRLGGGELGLSDCERDLPAGNPRARHRVLLCRRDRDRRRDRALAVRCADRHRLALERFRRLFVWRGADAHRGGHRGALRRRRRTQAARERGAAARRRRLRRATGQRVVAKRGGRGRIWRPVTPCFSRVERLRQGCKRRSCGLSSARRGPCPCIRAGERWHDRHRAPTLQRRGFRVSPTVKRKSGAPIFDNQDAIAQRSSPGLASNCATVKPLRRLPPRHLHQGANRRICHQPPANFDSCSKG